MGENSRAAGWKRNLPLLRFAVTFLGLIAAFQWAYDRVIVQSELFKAYLGANGRAAAAVLGLLGEEVTASDNVMTAGFTMSIGTGCDGLQAMAILTIAVLAFPGGGWKKVLAVVGGMALIGVLNVLRLVTLFWAGEHWPKMFEPMHLHIWPAILIVVALSYSIAWFASAIRS